MKFGTAMHISPPHLMGDQSFRISKSKMTDGRHLKNKKLRYLHNHLADFDEILHGDTYYSSRTYSCLKKIKRLKIQDVGRPPF